MGKKSRRRRPDGERARPEGAETSESTTPAARERPWYTNPFKTGLVGAVIGVLAAFAGFMRDGCDGSPGAGDAAVVASLDGGTAPQAAGDAGQAPASAAAVTRLAEAEANNTPEQAQAVPRLPADVTGELAAGDRDVFKVTVTAPEPQLLDAWVEGLPGAQVTVSRADGKELAKVAAPGRVGALGVIRGDILVAVTPGSSAGKYQLKLRLRTWFKGFDWEPNDEYSRAQAMAVMKQERESIVRYRASGWWSRPGDIDCYFIRLQVPPKGAMVQLELQPPAGVEGHLRLLDSGDKPKKIEPKVLVEVSSPGPGRPAAYPAVGGRSWESGYHACVSAAKGADFEHPYQLKVRLYTPTTPFEFEPNSTRETASALPLYVPLRGYLPTGDFDWLRLSGRTPTQRVTLQAPDGVAVELTLHDEQGKETAKGSAEGGKKVSVMSTKASFAKVRATKHGSLTQTYEILAEMPKDGGT